MRHVLRLTVTSAAFLVLTAVASQPASAQLPSVEIDDPENNATFGNDTALDPEGSCNLTNKKVIIEITNIFHVDGSPVTNYTQREYTTDSEGRWYMPGTFTVFGGNGTGGSWEVKVWVDDFPSAQDVHTGSVTAQDG